MVALRGYDKEEVDAFLRETADACAQALEESRRGGLRPTAGVILWTPAELSTRRQSGTDPLVTEAYSVGVVVYGRLPD